MDANTSEEELVIKTRKPYTITKQRERWTEQEHNRFLEALRLYGRAWQRIEEHIGTKTAVQIRSHAQKFFSKLEKDAQAKGVPVSQALDIEIPPPRPKRKPSTPYPRKPGNGAATSYAAGVDGKLVPSISSSNCKQALKSEKEQLPEKLNGDGKLSNAEENQGDNCSEVFTLHPDARCSSISSVNKSSALTTVALNNTYTFKEFIPSLRKATPEDGASKASNMDSSCNFHDKSLRDMNKDGGNDTSPTDDTQATQNYPRHVPVYVLNGSSGTCTQTQGPHDLPFCPIGEGIHGHSNSFTNAVVSAITTDHQNDVPKPILQPFPAFHPAFTPSCHTTDDYQSFLQILSTFSNLIISTLLQNPAAHAAASFAASFWPYANIGSSNDLPRCSQAEGGFPHRQMSSPPSIAAIAAATVAAATAWWAAHGLLPLCAPFTCPPISATAVPSGNMGQATVAKTDRGGNCILENPPRPNPEQSEALQAQTLASKSPASSSSDSEESGRRKLNAGSKTDDHKEAAAVPEEVKELDKAKNKKQVDRSSCGSNTPSGSDAEADALEKVEKDKEELTETDPNQPASESSYRRCRSTINSSDSWKEVSEEGRLAFQALFSREVLPQSFSPQYDMENNENKNTNTETEEQNSEKKDGDTMVLDLNINTRDCSSNNQEERKKALSTEENNDHERGLPTIGLGPGTNLKARRTGFKPYKRCSVEAKENRIMNTSSQAEEKVAKRLRLEGEAST